MPGEEQKIDKLNRKAYSITYIDGPKALEMAQEASVLSSEINYTKGTAWSLMIRGLLDIELGKYSLAEEKLYQVDHIFEALDEDTRGLAASRNSMGLLKIRQGNLKEALTYIQKALEISTVHGFRDLEYTAVNYLGILQYKAENYSQSLRFFMRLTKLSTDGKLAPILNNIGCVHREMGHYKEALQYLNNALDYATKENRLETRIPILEELGMTHGMKGDCRKGIEILLQALNECPEYQNRYRLSIYTNLTDLYIRIEDFDAAEQILKKALEIDPNLNSVNSRKLLLFMSRISENREEFVDALEYYKKYNLLSQELKSSELIEKLWLNERESLQNLNRRISTVSNLGKKLTALLEKNEVIISLLDALNDLFAPDYCILSESLVEAQDITLQFHEKQKTVHEKKLYLKVPPDNAISWAMENRTGLLMNNIEGEYNTYLKHRDDSVLLKGTQSIICQPYTTKGKRGILAICKYQENAFNSEDREFLELLTSYAAIALNNADQTKQIMDYILELESANRFDSLTGIYNRKYILKKIEKSWKASCRHQTFFHVLLIDLDNFKIINDHWGHDVGDQCLKAVGKIFQHNLQRISDGYGRYGGEEFLLYIQGGTQEEAVKMAEKVRESIESVSIVHSGSTIYLTASIGLSSINMKTSPEHSIQELINEADKNMYMSKNLGKNKVTASRID